MSSPGTCVSRLGPWLLDPPHFSILLSSPLAMLHLYRPCPRISQISFLPPQGFTPTVPSSCNASLPILLLIFQDPSPHALPPERALPILSQVAFHPLILHPITLFLSSLLPQAEIVLFTCLLFMVCLLH